MSEYEQALRPLEEFLIEGDAGMALFLQHVDAVWWLNVSTVFQVQLRQVLALSAHGSAIIGIRQSAAAIFKLGWDARGPAMKWVVLEEGEDVPGCEDLCP